MLEDDVQRNDQFIKQIEGMSDEELSCLVGAITNTGKVFIPNWFIYEHACNWVDDLSVADWEDWVSEHQYDMCSDISRLVEDWLLDTLEDVER